MNQQKMSTGTIALLSLLGGAVLGAVAVALTTPKNGRQVRRDLKALGLRTKHRADEMGGRLGEAWTESMDRTGQSAADLKRGVHEAAEDLKRGMREAAEDLKRSARAAAADFKAPAAPGTEVNNAAKLT